MNIIQEIHEKMNSQEFQAAYALNMCTVSVSQIVDYNDIIILEQEYEAILNNLNLELMPKDEALLDILKHLLDTITYFRIEEGEKQFIEREYEHKMKNAIWASVPNLAMLIASPDPVAIGVSLAAQVGIGYMNYRKNRAEYEFEKEKAYWELQKTALEQFNALRRELFNTAWRLADTYNFPDEYRLTERQIKQYNRILMDTDEMRRFERLKYIEHSFCAYPPFWYFLGHAANEIYRNEKYSSEMREYYKNLAKEYFELYWSFKKINILREDQLLASCILEYIDLLDPKEQRERISQLLVDAQKTSGNTYDVLQLCAFSYLKIEDYLHASQIFRHLVNERYNTVLNAQLLSQLYVCAYLKTPKYEYKWDYETLANRINVKYLFPFPEHGTLDDTHALSSIFFENQKITLKKGFNRLIRTMFRQRIISLNKIIPYPNQEPMEDYYYSNEKNLLAIRRNNMKNYLQTDSLPIPYQNKLRDIELQYIIIRSLNDLLDSIRDLKVLYDSSEIWTIIRATNKILFENSQFINDVQINFKDGKLIYSDFEKLESLFDKIYRECFRYILNYGQKRIDKTDSMLEISQVENGLLNVCTAEHIPSQILAADDFTANLSTDSVPEATFTMSIFGNKAAMYEKLIVQKNSIQEIIKTYIDDLIVKSYRNQCHIYLSETYEFTVYTTNDRFKELYTGVSSKIAAIIADKKNHSDMIFTPVGIYIKNYSPILVHTLELSDLIPYNKISSVNGSVLILNGMEYSNAALDVNAFINMVHEITELQNK